MDDFGSGYSSLNLLKDMPVDVLKIDMKFLNKSKDELRSQKIIQNIIKLSNDLSISSLTEGVETEEQFHMLSEMSCNLFQGYYFAKPMPVNDFEDFYKERNK
jgi:EAL domain-containing protein (putative c-di-GMP-specific phosphodiesterase class I)